jgi:drug/metabolite transporter (DMT)-like permease
MPGFAVALVLVSALLHAVWNFLNKDSEDRWAFYLGQSSIMLVVGAPVAVWFWPAAGVDGVGWVYILASAIVHTGYAWCLLQSYDAGDVSVAYPLSRTAPILVAGWDVMNRGEVTGFGLFGAVLAGVGALVLQLPALSRLGPRAVFAQAVTRYALMTSVCIAIYTIIDKHGVSRVPAFAFLYCMTLGEVIMISACLGRSITVRIKAEARRNLRAVVTTALISPFSYLLILWVLAAAPASYVLALRQTSIVFGVLLGSVLLGEGQARYRLVGAMTIALGGILVAAAG